MKKIILIFIVFFTYFSNSEKIDVIQNENSIDLYIEDIYANCESKFASDIKIQNKNIIIVQTDTIPDKAYCNCYFDIQYNISGINDINNIYIYRQELKKFNYPKDTLKLIFNKKLNFTGTNKINSVLNFHYLQSNCKSLSSNKVEKNDFDDFKIIPNKFSSSIEIKFYLNESADINLKIFNMLGKEIINLNSASLKKGYNQLILNASKIPDGVYIGKIISSQGKIKSFKLIWQN